MTPLAVARGVVETARTIGEAVAGPAADAVDRDARFPHEAIAALREERMLGAFVPRELGGLGATIGEVAAVVRGTRPRLRLHGHDLSRCTRSRSLCLVRHGLSVILLSRLSGRACRAMSG